MTRRIFSGTLEVLLPSDQALPLFTPAGEREWVPGWDPQFPSGEDSSPGTTFTTYGGRTLWVIVGRTHASMRYARVMPASTSARSKSAASPPAPPPAPT